MEFRLQRFVKTLTQKKAAKSDYAEGITESKRELQGLMGEISPFLFPNALSCSQCMVARHTLIILLTGIAWLPLSLNYCLSLQIGFLFFNVPFNAVSPNPVHR